MELLSDQLKKAVNDGMSICNQEGFKVKESPCCPGIQAFEAISCWPPLYNDEKAKELTLELLLKFSEEKIKVISFHYKLSKKTKMLSALQVKYTQGIQTPVFKANDETEDEMQTFTLSKKQLIAKLVLKRIDRTTKEWQFID